MLKSGSFASGSWSMAFGLGCVGALLLGCGPTVVEDPVKGTGGSAGAHAGTGGSSHTSGGSAANSAGTAGKSGGSGGATSSTCYSPTQNTSNAYEPGAKGCACDASEPDVCVSGAALICSGGFWQAVEDGPCQPMATPTGTACGARAGDTCSATEYCAYEEGQFCGAADGESVCKPRPEACIELYAPVCGCDQKTYSNSCFANAAGTGIAAAGACK